MTKDAAMPPETTDTWPATVADPPHDPAHEDAPAVSEPASDPADAAEAAWLGPSDEEVEAWAERERERRRAWLEGPTAQERAAWARRERLRRMAELGPVPHAAAAARRGRRYGRETMLATEGAVSLFSRWSRRALAELVHAGLEWEDEVATKPRRRIRLDDEER
jgi:hypothetical protein